MRGLISTLKDNFSKPHAMCKARIRKSPHEGWKGLHLDLLFKYYKIAITTGDEKPTNHLINHR